MKELGVGSAGGGGNGGEFVAKHETLTREVVCVHGHIPPFI